MEVVNTVGRRKAAVARVYVKPGKGQITINRKALEFISRSKFSSIR